MTLDEFHADTTWNPDGAPRDGYTAKATISEHGYAVKILVELNYNILSGRRIGNAHKAVQAVIDSALDTADGLRGYNPAMFDVDDLIAIQPDTVPDMDTEHA